jgi:UTP--glucose-1-phosphate uridylyltransferase
MVQHDTGCLAQMAAQYASVGGNLVAVENVPASETYRYGVLDPGTENGDLVEVKGLVEKPAPEDAPSTLAIIGRYILDGKIMDTLSAFKKGAGGEIQITDAMAELIGQVPMHGFRFAGTRYDCGNRDGFLEANLAFALAEGGAPLKQRLRPLLD